MLAPLCIPALLTMAAAPAPPTVAVLYFDYQGKNEPMAVLRKGLAQMLISDLQDTSRYQLVERDRLEDILAELKLGRSAKIDKATANRIGKILGARYLVLGGYFDLMNTLRVDARVVEVETSKVVGSAGAHATPDDFMKLEQKLSEDLKKILTTKLTVTQQSPKKRKRPKRPKRMKTKTALKYAQALDAKDRGDTAKARATMKEVIKEQPDFALAQLDLNALLQ